MHYSFVNRLKYLLCASAVALAVVAPVQACQIVCLATNTSYTGNLGGLTGADNKCAAEYTGFKFARSATLAMNLPMTNGNFPYVWAPLGNTNNCSNWTSTGGTGMNMLGTSTPNSYVYSYQSSPRACSFSLPILCCNM